MQYSFNGFKATRPVVRLVDKEKQHYEVYFTYYAERGKKKVYRHKKEINSHKAIERKRFAEEAAYIMWEALHNGWNPLNQKYPAYQDQRDRIGQLSFAAALDHGMKVKEKTLADLSKYNYTAAVRFFKTAAMACGLHDTRMQTIQRPDIRLIVSTAKEQMNWSAKARNQNLAILRSLLSVLVDEDRLKFNPATDIKKEKAEPVIGYREITEPEKIRIAEHLSITLPDFLDFVLFVYHVGMRPKEILMLQVSDINLLRREIIVRPEVSKTNRQRIVPITDDLRNILLAKKVNSLNKDWYLFSQKKFAPGPVPYRHTAGNRWWRKLVVRDLGISAQLYGLKHAGADAKILSGLPIDVLRSLYGHSSTQMTERYVTKLQEKYKEQIIDKSPSFTSKVVEMKRKEG